MILPLASTIIFMGQSSRAWFGRFNFLIPSITLFNVILITLALFTDMSQCIILLVYVDDIILTGMTSLVLLK